MDTRGLMTELAEKIEKTANVKAAFGEPIGQAEERVIPVARVTIRGGGGGGAGQDPNDSSKKGTGLGMGMNIVTSPVGYINWKDGAPRFSSITDRNRMIIAGAIVAGVALMAFLRNRMTQ